MVEADLIELVSVPSPSCTSSREDEEMRCAVSNGDFAWIITPGFACSSSSLPVSDSCIEVSSSVEACSDIRGVEVEEDGPPSVRERGIEDVDIRDFWDCGRDVVSGASSKVSCRKLAINCRRIWGGEIPLLYQSFRHSKA